MKRFTLSAVILPFASLCMLACEPDYSRLDIDVISDPNFYVDIGDGHVELLSGTAVMVEVEPVSSSYGDFEKDDSVELVSEETDIFAIYQGTEHREFAFVGVSPGKTRMEIHVKGKLVDHMDVTILARPPEIGEEQPWIGHNDSP